MKVNLWDFEGGEAYAEYDDFKLGGLRSSYRMTVGDYRGNAGTGFSIEINARV